MGYLYLHIQRDMNNQYISRKVMGTFATKLKELRGAESQASFAAAIDINRVQYAKYESGANSPSIDVLSRICRVHACSADWLLGLKEEREGGAGARVRATGGSSVAIGSGSRATVNGAQPLNPSAHQPPSCARCPYKKKLLKLEKLLQG